MTARNPSNYLPHLIGPIDFQVNGIDSGVERRGTINVVGLAVADDPDNDRTNLTVTAGATPTGTGVTHIVAGAQSAAASLVVDADVSASAAIAGSKLAAATTSLAGTLSAADKTKLDGLQKQGTALAIAALAIDWATGGVFAKTLAAGANAFTFANAASGMMITVVLTGAASTVSWPAGTKWPGGTVPVQTASGVDVYTFINVSGTVYGALQQAFA